MSDYQIDAVSKEEWYECAWRDARDECDRINYVVKEMNASADIMRERLDASLDEITRLRADLAAARELGGWAYINARQACNSVAVDPKHNSASALLAVNACQEAILSSAPADATAALEARDARVRAEERAKVIVEAKALASRSIKDGGIARPSTFFVYAEERDAFKFACSEYAEKLDALHTDESRKAGGE